MSLKSQNDGSLFVPVFLASAAVLLYEMAQIRVFSYSLPPILAYAAISLAMTGFGMGAALLSLVPGIPGHRPRVTLAVLAILQSAGMIAANLVFARCSWDVILNMDTTGMLPVVFRIVLPCTLPYFFSGLFFAVVFSAGTTRVGTLYFWNLLGSGIGTLFLVVLLVPFGAEGILVLAAGLCLLSASILALRESRLLLVQTVLLLALCAGLFQFATVLFPFAPDPKDLLGYALRTREKESPDPIVKEVGEWNLVGKIEIWNHKSESLSVPERLPFRMLHVDAGASSLLAGEPAEPGWGRELFEETVYGLAYLAKPAPDQVLVIGPGGGLDIQSALHAGARRITGVEVNQSTIRVCKGPYAGFLKWPASERVSLVHGDGRSFVKGCQEKFDVIQMSGVDTLTVYATGSLNMVEEYLYTVEAFESYLEALNPDGVLCVLRFGAEYLRLAMIASEALARQGITEPERHLALFSQNLWTGLLVSKGGFTARQIESLQSLASRKIANGVRIPPYDSLKIGLSDPVEIIYLPVEEYLPRLEEFQELTASLDLNPKTRRLLKALIPTDDNPFYMLPVLYVLSLPSQLTGGVPDTVKGAVLNGIQIVKLFWSGILIVSFVAIFLPVVLVRGRMTSYGSLFWVLPYFFLIGLSFMLLEICTINKFAIFTGSPGSSIIVVLSGILVSSGIGSYVSELSGKRPEVKIALATGMVILSLSVLRWVAPVLFELCWEAGLGQVLRCVVASILIVPMGFALGWFFPSGLKAVQVYLPDPRVLPWAISINGFASVLGSIAALPISVFFGFNTLAAFALAGYLLAGALSLFFFRRQPDAFAPAASPAAP